ncbi:MAG: hypothetical protein J2P40_03585 [Candidatus Dormibacteraeota bacterium]|nr:hypothetical protein [Candidatus Dormibacteraeota bacterium]MBO0704155.1 hypothetical protein [Candidatus Dormibacteraeota bacterium]MBO0760336.1 hypothetical protein [Candidatus Dormibacteraeota bacterium]
MSDDDDHGARQLDWALRLEQDVLAEMRALLEGLPADDPHRGVLERHQGNLEEAVGQIEAIMEQAPGRRAGRS